MIDSMKKVENADTNFSTEIGNKTNIKVVTGKLPSLFESQKTDQNLMKINELEQELAALRNENQRLKENIGTSAQGQIGTQSDLHQLSVIFIDVVIKILNQKFEQLSIEHQQLLDESQKKLNESAQFNNLKKMIQQKNEQLKEFKDRQTNNFDKI